MSNFPVISKPHPLKTETCLTEFKTGTSLACVVGKDASDTVSIAIEGEYIPREMWERIKPKSGQLVHVVRYPMGDTVKKIIGLVLLVVIAIYAPYLLKTMVGMFGTFWGTVAAIGITLLATAAAYALIPPPEIPKMSDNAGAEFNRLNAITGTSNNAVPYGTIPMVLGECRFFPTYAANPYTEILGDQQYLRLLLDLGWGNNLEVSDIKIGETPITDFEGVEYEISTQPDLFTDDVFELSLAEGLDPGAEVLKTSQLLADELSIDIVFGGGLFGVNDKGDTTKATTSITVEYRLVGVGTWSNVASISQPQLSLSSPTIFSNGAGFTIASSARKTLRIGMRWPVNQGQYEIRVRRQATTFGSGTNDSAKFDSAQLVVFRSIRKTNPSTTGTLKLAVRIKATDQLNGVVNQLSVLVQQKIKVYDSVAGTWTAPQANFNPAWVYHWLLTECPGVAQHVDPSRIDLSTLSKWALDCTIKGFTVKGMIDRAISSGELFKMVISAGRGSFAMRDGLYSVLYDRDGLIPVQHFTPTNTKNFSGNRIFIDLPHALRVRFQNPAFNWQEDEIIVLDDEHSHEGKDARGIASSLPPATKFETLALPYVTEPQAAWLLGRYQLAQGIFRPNMYSWSTDVEHLVCTRGSLVNMVHDVTSWGSGFGYISSLLRNGSDEVIEITTLEPYFHDLALTYSVRVRTKDNNTYISNIVPPTESGEMTVMNLVTPMGGDVDETDIYMIGNTVSAIRELLITRIEPSSDLSATLTGVEYTPAVQTFDDNPPTAFVSSITGTMFLEPPPPPTITATFSHHTQPPDDGGGSNPGVSVTIDPGSSGYRPPVLERPNRNRDDFGRRLHMV